MGVSFSPRTVARAFLLGSTGLTLACLPAVALAQAGQAPAQTSDPAVNPQAPHVTDPVNQTSTSPSVVPGSENEMRDASGDMEIIVTGSSIRGAAPVGSALIGVTRDTIQTNAPANTKELLANVPQLGNFGTNAEQSTSNRFRTAGYQPNIHNVGIYATLTLFNGHRFAPVGGEAVFPDPSIIPVIAVQRVEVVADGGSAIYGSDAVAGVVNFIYRKDVEGVEVAGTFGFNDSRYRKYNAAIIAGQSWDGGNITAAYEYSENKSPLNTDIDFLALGGDQRSRGGRDLRGTNCLLPNINVVTQGGDVRGTNYAYNADGTVTAGQNRCGVLSPSTIIPDAHRHAVLVTAHQQLGANVDLWFEGNYSNYQTRTFGTQSNLTLRIPSTNPYFAEGLPAGMDPSTVAGGYYLVRRSALGLFDPRDPAQEQSSKVWGVTVGADIDVGGDWRITPMLHVSKTNDFNSDPELDPLGYEAAANLTTSAALNPFGQAADNDPATLALIENDYRRDNITSQRLRELQVKGDGPLFAIGGGDVLAAIGVDFREEQAIQLQTSGTPARPDDLFLVRDDNITRTVMAGFGELNVPFVSGQNAMPFLERLTLSLAGRLDYYTQYGAKFNPKVGLVVEPFLGYSVHGSYGTSFVAPNLGLLGNRFGFVGSQNTTTGWNYTSPDGQNIIIGNIAGTQLPVYNLYNSGGGNPDLEPETANTWSIGVDIEPPQIDRLRLAVTYYNVTYKNTIYKATQQDVFTNPAFAPYVFVNPTPGVPNPALDAELAAEFLISPPEMDVASYIYWDVIFRSYAINLGQRKFEGLDIETSYDLPTGIGTFSLSANANVPLVDKQQVLPGTPWSSRIGTELSPDWKGRMMLNWNYDPFTLNVAVSHISSFDFQTGNRVTFEDGIQRVGSFTTVDLAARVALDSLREGLSIQGRIANLLDEDPPFVDNANGYLPAQASPFGRQFEVTVRAAF